MPVICRFMQNAAAHTPANRLQIYWRTMLKLANIARRAVPLYKGGTALGGGFAAAGLIRLYRMRRAA